MHFMSVLLVLLPVAVHAALPLSKQHPLIARVDQPYSWTISPLTFDNVNSSTIFLRKSPGWLIYDNATSTFRGTPALKDTGVTTVRVHNQFGASDRFQLCVSELPPPTVNIPLESQLVPGNPSISSGFTFSTPNIGVRVPPKWSFSIGFDGTTFTTPDERDVYYDATLVNGLPLPGWIIFNNQTLTFDGVAPPMNRSPRLSIVLYGSDRWGFGAIQAQFDLVIGPRTHLLGVDGVAGLETVNVTGGIPFTHSIKTFGGLAIDGVPVVAANISHVEVNVSSAPWAVFDTTTRVLSGLPPLSAIGRSGLVFPVSITSDYNDTVDTSISLAVFASYFISASILPVAVTAGMPMTFSLKGHIANGHSTSVTIVPEYIPRAASSWLSYDASNAALSGIVPRSANYNEVNVTFSATDLETHTVSTTSLLLSISYNATSGPEVWEHRQGHNVNHRARTAIVVIFSVIGGAILVCCLLALCRRYCGAHEPREDDESSSQWKGQDATQLDTHYIDPPEKMMRGIGLGRASDETFTSEGGCKLPVSVVVPPGSHNTNFGPRLTGHKGVRIFKRLLASSKRKLQDQSLGSQSGKIRRSQISRPTLIDEHTLEYTQNMLLEDGRPSDDTWKNLIKHREGRVPEISSNAPSSEWSRVEPKAQRGPPRENLTQATGDRNSQVVSESDESSLTSTPRRRSDFLPPRDQRQRMEESEQPCAIGSGQAHCITPSGSSGTINDELREAAVITTAARQVLPSVVSTSSVDRSVVRSSMDSAHSATLSKNRSSPSSPGSMSITGVRRPRLVQLNSEKRVLTSNEGASTSRNRSQKAVIGSSSQASANSNESDEIDQDRRLSLGIRYFPSLGDGVDAGSAVFYMTPSVGKSPSPVVELGKSPVVSNQRAESTAGPSLASSGVNNLPTHKSYRQSRIRIGTPFTISIPFEIIPARGAELSVRQQNGESVPAWIKFDQRDVELWGVPLKEHLGIHLLEIVEGTDEGQRVVARMSLEVV
ncbi:unnamed protein product [Rhizoctonia solani]|uniref:Dystroglycan-type cadherin-like domain-containing protein n=1 Tax=Rhizoctonia solani TaxID=456999 RepID=A0A8H3A5H2_9AGAM|nr:unnamed protein product [Rhizoctonia solani]CAE6495543.1 unnamed protein product [Rhizoctonia solani]